MTLNLAALAPERQLTLSDRSAIAAFVAMDVLREANSREARGENIIHMETGQPGTPAPRLAREAAKRALDTETLGYTNALGVPLLRERIANLYRTQYGVNVESDQIVVTTGSSAGFVLAFLALMEAGDVLALPEPGYPCYRQIARVLGLKTAPIAARGETRFAPSEARFGPELTAAGAKAVILASPANPTGTMVTPEALKSFVHEAERRGVWFISDEIYHRLTFVGEAHTALEYSENAIIINSFSKYYSMTGWRVGWLVVPKPLARAFERLAQNLYVSPPAISQVAALGALEATEELDANRAVYAKNREMLLNEFPKAGFTKLAPADGAFYLYADISDRTDDADAFAKAMLAEVGVAATPGMDFDESQGRHFIRFSYAGTFERMREAAHRLQNWKR